MVNIMAGIEEISIWANFSEDENGTLVYLTNLQQTLGMTDEELRELDNRALDLVRKHHGYIYLQGAIEDERNLLGGD